MIKRLRVRIILSAILAFALVIFFISVLVNVINYRIVTKQADETLQSIICFEREPNEKPPIPPFMGLKNPEAEYITRFFMIRYDEQGNIIQVADENIAASLREETEKLAKVVIEKKENAGYIEGYRYRKESRGKDNLIVFLNVMQDQQYLRVLRLITWIVALLSLLIVSILVVLFSGAAIRPIVQNIERQKQFITDASHELKTPLTSIVTSLDVITMENGENEWTENIRNQSARMTKLVGEMVTLSRMDEAKPIYVKEKFSLSDMAWEMLEIYQSRSEANGRQIQTSIEENLSMYGEKNAIGQMLSVLLDNAIKYAKGEGPITLKVAWKHKRVFIEVTNPTEYQEPVDVDRLFDRFYRPDSSRNADDGGSGIGLAIAKAVVEAHEGKITAECPNGQRMIIKVKI